MPGEKLPNGTVSFLFTDIEGSTGLWEAYPELMKGSLARHDTLLREAIQAANGTVFKTVGDAFCAAFWTAFEAVEAAILVQLALNSENWPSETNIRVRMALHTGTVESRDDDYFGAPVNRVARMLGIAHGGQVVMSTATLELVRDKLPPGVMLRNLGEHRLKDLGRPETVFQILHSELPSEFPPLRSLDNPELHHNLIQQVTSFIGRESELDTIHNLLNKTRLLTLTGSGGSGKTRLALQAAADHLDGSGDGVWLVELAPIADPSQVAHAVANVLGVKEEPGQPMERTLVRSLKNRRLLLLLDNCEHVLSSCASLADLIHKNCPHIVMLATSRQGLGIAGETTFRVPSLSVPDIGQVPTADDLNQFESVRLFVDRARQVKTTFEVNNQNASAIASICNRLDGIPLAIELAAARIRSLTPDDINNKLDQRFRLLTDGLRTALPRQQTLRSMIDWSFDLLNESERALFARLTVFAGGWTLASAEEVCSGSPLESMDVVNVLDSLCEKSLVVSETHGLVSRFRMLETVRQYAHEVLENQGITAKIRDRHRDHFLAFANEADACLQGPGQAEWLDRMEREHENLRSAMEWCLADTNDEFALQLCSALGRYWCTRGYLTEGREYCKSVLNKSANAIRNLHRARALNSAGRLAYFQGDYESSLHCLSECLSIAREVEDDHCIAQSLSGLGLVACGRSDYKTSQNYLLESLEISRKTKDAPMIAIALNNLGNNCEYSGDYASASIYLEECLTISREIGYRQNIAAALYNLGNVARILGDYVQAREYLQECFAISQELGYRLLIAESLESFANLMAVQHFIKVAATLWGASEALREEMGVPRPPDDQTVFMELLALAREELDDETFDKAWFEGSAMSMSQAIALAVNSI